MKSDSEKSFVAILCSTLFISGQALDNRCLTCKVFVTETNDVKKQTTRPVFGWVTAVGIYNCVTLSQISKLYALVVLFFNNSCQALSVALTKEKTLIQQPAIYDTNFLITVGLVKLLTSICMLHLHFFS